MAAQGWERARRGLAAAVRFAAPPRRSDSERVAQAPSLPPGRVVDVPGRGEMFVREVAAGPDAPTILLLHGWGLTADGNWFRAYDAVARHGRVLAVDVRGHGRSLRSDEAFTLEAAADDAAALLEHLDAGPAVVVGYSMGGSIALLTWRRHPESVRALVLKSTALHWRSDVWERLLWRGMPVVELALRLSTPQGLVDRYLREVVAQAPEVAPHLGWLDAEVRRGDPAGIAGAGRALRTFDARAFAGRIDVPTAVIVSCRDRLVRPHRKRALAAAIPNAEVVELDAGHDGWLVRPAAVAAALEAALDLVIAADRPRGA